LFEDRIGLVLVARLGEDESVASWNPSAIWAYSKADFRGDHRRQGAVVTYGQRHDQVLMDAVAEEFTDSVLAKHTPPSTESPGRP
jgi:hypothetical protein